MKLKHVPSYWLKHIANKEHTTQIRLFKQLLNGDQNKKMVTICVFNIWKKTLV